MAACLAAFVIATITSRVPRLSVEMLGYAVLLAELYLLLVALMRRPRFRAHFERLAIVLCLLVCVLYLLQVLQAWQLWWGAVGHLTIPLLRPGYLGLSLSPNPIATLVLLLGAFGLATGRLRGRAGRAVSVALLVLVAATTVITGSRGAWIGAGAALFVCVLAALIMAPTARGRAATFVRTRLGIDLNPIDVTSERGARLLRAFIWPDQAERRERLERAIEVVRADPPQILRGDYLELLEPLLNERSDEALTVVYQTASLSHLSSEGRLGVEEILAHAGERGPLAFISGEHPPNDPADYWQLRFQLWPGGEPKILARLDYHGRWLEWLG